LSGEETLEQARTIHRTVRMIHDRVVRRAGLPPREVDEGNDLCAVLTFPQFNMLMVLQEKGESTIKDLAEALQVSAPSASTMVDRLVDLGVVDRSQSVVDRRTVLVRLKAPGEAAMVQFEEYVLQGLSQLLERLGPEMAETWCNIYRRIGNLLQEDASGGGFSPDATKAPV
jgi:DNA-binding MarR family transcriptional regulator